jgi:hypothetical protein
MERNTMNKSDKWRLIGKDRIRRHADSMHSLILMRSMAGQTEYGSEFKGDPLDQAEEELIDGLFYVGWARRKMTEAELNWSIAVDEIERLKGIIADLQGGLDT